MMRAGGGMGIGGGRGFGGSMRSLIQDRSVVGSKVPKGTVRRILRCLAPYKGKAHDLLSPDDRRLGDRGGRPAHLPRRSSTPASATETRTSSSSSRWSSAALRSSMPGCRSPSALLVPGRRRTHLRPADPGLRPRPADAARLLHPHPDRRARQPAQQRRARRRSRRSPTSCPRSWATSSASCWSSPTMFVLSWQITLVALAAAAGVPAPGALHGAQASRRSRARATSSRPT